MTTTTTGLTNSKRRFEKATYTPLITQDRQSAGDQSASGDALGRAALIRILELTPGELTTLEGSGTLSSDALSAVTQVMSAVTGIDALAGASSLALVPDSDLQAMATALKALRTSLLQSTTSQVEALNKVYVQALSAPPQQSTTVTSARSSTDAMKANPTLATKGTAIKAAAKSENAASSKGVRALVSADLAAPDRELPVRILPASGVPKAGNVMPLTFSGASISVQPLATPVRAAVQETFTWGLAKQPSSLFGLISNVRAALPAFDASSADMVASLIPELNRRVFLVDLFSSSLTLRAVNPLGLLHLERLEMTPLDVQRGQLVYSLPLSPTEKVTLSHKEWSSTEQEYTEYIEDYLENYSETGVAQSSDLAMSSQVQTQHSNALSMSQAPVTQGAFSSTTPVTATTSGSTVEDQSTLDQSKDLSRTVTSLASARTIQDHKVSFTVTTVSGMEDFTSRLITNPSIDHTMRIDYFKRMQSWKTDLYRYGVRLTYDVVLPDPGRDLRAREEEIASINRAFMQPFTFSLAQTDITTWNWDTLAEQYEAALPAPPAPGRLETSTEIAHTESGTGFVQTIFDDTVTMAIPDGYTITSLWCHFSAATWLSGVGAQWVTIIGGGIDQSFDAGTSGYIDTWVTLDPTSLSESGSVALTIRSKGIATGAVKLFAELSPSDSAIATWQLNCWSALHDAAFTDFTALKDVRRQRKSDLQSQISGEDTVTLRKMEREQIMRCVLEWLFPGFGDAGSVLEGIPSPDDVPPGTWQRIMEYGEYIKFVHEAIDWDNVSVFLYPYFWDKVENQATKLFLDHPDAIRREFLRAGAARVILAIVPGYESDVTSLLYSGQLGAISNESAFSKIISDVQAANATYEATRKASTADPDDPGVGGILVGTWTDYTPTSALDSDVVLTPVLVTS